ncbi:DUF5405 family protein [Mixta mediterraneensis]|uniref:DUF5405 family protein n=1 Tax=Mixta mediterraneensis TaxID=2758443 RepID=UPI00187467F0|nr:DUF5405 family protein [Mixta mediterraneensis]MBE5254153.1 DUF5405 family protein [Mixta mediterraneensis]
MRVKIDDVYFLRAIRNKQPGEDALVALERLSWMEVEGVREHVPLTMAIYSSKILLLRDLISDVTGRLVLHGNMDTFAAFVSETRRLAEQTQVAFEKLKAEQVANV